MPNEIQSPKEEHHWRLGKYIRAGRLANYYAVCTSLPSHNCSFAIEFSWIFNFLRDIPFPHLHIAICHLKKSLFCLPKMIQACFPVPESYFVENRRSWDLPGNTKIIKSSIKTWIQMNCPGYFHKPFFFQKAAKLGVKRSHALLAAVKAINSELNQIWSSHSQTRAFCLGLWKLRDFYSKIYLQRWETAFFLSKRSLTLFFSCQTCHNLLICSSKACDGNRSLLLGIFSMYNDL